VASAPSQTAPLIDGFGRRIDYVRLSVTDRCDLRCVYCMPERMQFLPRADLLSIDELAELGAMLIRLGVRRIRLTGGEPLVRPGVLGLAAALGSWIGRGLDELTLTTNGTQLAGAAEALAAAGVKRINVSLDSRDPERFRAITRGGDLGQVLDGIDAAAASGLRVKINMVALRGLNEDEIGDMLAWCGARGFDLSLIETMPLGLIEEDRTDRYLPLPEVRAALERRFTLIPSTHRTGGPSLYFDVGETGGRIGFITPLTGNFCATCNRVRVTATGTLYPCLGHARKVELREPLRAGDQAAVQAALDQALAAKPLAHDFDIARPAPAVARHMSVTGG
jgi:cyclic pyranopterin phosphate synthase